MTGGRISRPTSSMPPPFFVLRDSRGSPAGYESCRKWRSPGVPWFPFADSDQPSRLQLVVVGIRDGSESEGMSADRVSRIAARAGRGRDSSLIQLISEAISKKIGQYFGCTEIILHEGFQLLKLFSNPGYPPGSPGLFPVCRRFEFFEVSCKVPEPLQPLSRQRSAPHC